jgi:hypothetical protein
MPLTDQFRADLVIELRILLQFPLDTLLLLYLPGKLVLAGLELCNLF